MKFVVIYFCVVNAIDKLNNVRFLDIISAVHLFNDLAGIKVAWRFNPT